MGKILPIQQFNIFAPMKDFQSLRIVFMGTPAFAVASLDELMKAGCNVVAVVTAPDKPAGRGLLLQQSAVKQFAIQNNLHVLQPTKLKDIEFLNELKSLKADMQVVVAFRMLPEAVWSMPLMGTINLHGSLLPQYRGAAPINWAVINGEKTTGVTTFKLKHEIDTGDILMQESFTIGEKETAGDIHDRMMIIGAKLLVKTVKGLANKSLSETPQLVIGNNAPLNHAPKIQTETCAIDWNNPIDKVYNLIKGLSPYPTAFTMLDGKKLKIFNSKIEMTASLAHIGEYETDKKTFLKFACADGYVHLLDIQLEGKKRMPIENFLRGYHFS